MKKIEGLYLRWLHIGETRGVLDPRDFYCARAPVLLILFKFRGAGAYKTPIYEDHFS